MSTLATGAFYLAHNLTETVREVSVIKLAACIAVFVAGVVLLSLARRYGRAESSAQSQYQKEMAHRGWMVRSMAGAALLLVGLMIIPVFAFESVTRAVPHAEKELPTTTKGDFPVTVVASTAAGIVAFDIKNPNDYAVQVQCVIRALNGAGESVVTGTYTQFDVNGTKFQSEDYSVALSMLPQDSESFEVELNISEPVVRVDITCEAIPFTPEQINDLKSKGIPFKRSPHGGGASSGP
jgi:hypothetical protein